MENKSDIPNEEPKSSKYERHKTYNEYFRFITTLSTGSIVLLTSFLEKLTTQPKWGFLIGMSLTSFVVSIVGSVLAYTVGTFMFGRDISDKEAALLAIGVFLAWMGFLIAIIALTVFALVNFY